MRESFSLFILLKYKDPNGKLKIRNLIFKAVYFDGTPIWKMVIKDTLSDIKWRLKKL